MDDKGPDRFFFFYTFAIVDQPFWKYSDVQLDWKSTRDDSLNNFFCYTFGIVDQPFWQFLMCNLIRSQRWVIHYDSLFYW